MIKINKNIILTLSIISILIISTILTGCNQTTQENETIKIGVIVPLTNSVLASRGIDTKKSLELAVNEINSDGGINGKKIKLIIEDNEGKADKSLNSLNKLLMQDGKVNIFYSLFTGPTIAITPIIKENNKLLIYQSTVLSMARENNSYICNDYWNFEILGTKFAEIAYGEKANKVGLIRSQTEYGQSFENFFKKRADELGLDYTIETFQLSDKDVNTQITKFKYNGVDLIISDGFANNYLNLLNAINSLNYYNLTLIGTTTLYDVSKLDDPAALDILKKVKAISVYHPINEWPEGFEIFLNKWNNISSSHPLTEAIYAYDDMIILAKALKYCDLNSNIEDTKCLYEQIKSNKFNVLEGNVNIDENCIFERKLRVLKYNLGQWENYE